MKNSQIENIEKYISKITSLIYLFLILILFISGAISAYKYTFFGDELVHMNIIYLINEGKIPFKDFFTIYSPIFHYLMQFVLYISGLTISSFHYARIIMIGLFGLRLFISYFIIKKIVSSNAGLIFCLLLLFDPFTIHSGMQIRPENFGLLFVSLAFGVFTQKTWPNRLILFWGFICGFSALASLKVAPASLVILAIIFIQAVKNKNIRMFVFYFIGFISSPLIFGIYQLANGIFIPMFQNLFIDPNVMDRNIWNPTKFGFFYNFNDLLYGINGSNFMRVISSNLSKLSYILSFISLIIFYKQIKVIKIIVILFINIILQLIFINHVNVTFIQYYLVFHTFIYALISVFIDRFLHLVKNINVLFALLSIIILISFGWNTPEIISANQHRSQNNGYAQIELLQNRWSLIPEGTPVYPELIYRPFVYKVPTGFFLPELPEIIKNRYGQISDIVIKSKVPYLLLSEFEMGFLPDSLKQYIELNYMRVEADPELWKIN